MTEPRMVATDDLVGVADISDRCCVARQTVWAWTDRRHRNNFPMPVARLAMGPVFLWSEVSAWRQEPWPSK